MERPIVTWSEEGERTNKLAVAVRQSAPSPYDDFQEGMIEFARMHRCSMIYSQNVRSGSADPRDLNWLCTVSRCAMASIAGDREGMEGDLRHWIRAAGVSTRKSFCAKAAVATARAVKALKSILNEGCVDKVDKEMVERRDR